MLDPFPLTAGEAFLILLGGVYLLLYENLLYEFCLPYDPVKLFYFELLEYYFVLGPFEFVVVSCFVLLYPGLTLFLAYGDTYIPFTFLDAEFYCP